MWFIFPLIPAVMSSIAALYTVTKSSNFITFASGALLWNNVHGYKRGEGELTDREGGEYYGVGIDETSEHDITRDLGRLSKIMPSPIFAELINRKYNLTISEGELLRAMLHPAVAALSEFEEIKVAYTENPQDEDLLQFLMKSMELLTATVGPIVLYLKQFPKKRVKIIK